MPRRELPPARPGGVENVLGNRALGLDSVVDRARPIVPGGIGGLHLSKGGACLVPDGGGARGGAGGVDTAREADGERGGLLGGKVRRSITFSTWRATLASRSSASMPVSTPLASTRSSSDATEDSDMAASRGMERPATPDRTRKGGPRAASMELSKLFGGSQPFKGRRT